LDDGCEVNTKTNISHCGSCLTPCSMNHIDSTCDNGVCSGTCDHGWADCNNNIQSDGCECAIASSSTGSAFSDNIYTTAAALSLTLGVDYNEIPNLDQFKSDFISDMDKVLNDIASQSIGPIRSVRHRILSSNRIVTEITSVSSGGSGTTLVDFIAKIPSDVSTTPQQLFTGIESQLQSPTSTLRTGTVTSAADPETANLSLQALVACNDNGAVVYMSSCGTDSGNKSATTGIIVGVVLGAVVIFIIVYYCLRKHSAHTNTQYVDQPRKEMELVVGPRDTNATTSSVLVPATPSDINNEPKQNFPSPIQANAEVRVSGSVNK